MTIEIDPIGYVRNSRAQVEDDAWGDVTSHIELTGGFDGDAFAGLDTFSHAEVLFHFDRVAESKIVRGARHPRNNPAWPLTGIFAQRGKNRPNRLGSTIVAIIAVRGTTLEVAGLDAVDGTPVIDIKPMLREFLPRGDFRQPPWATDLMAHYWGTEAP